MSSTHTPPLVYVDCDIPDGVTLVAWRRERDAAERRSRAEVREARSLARRNAIRRRLPRLGLGLGLGPKPSFRPRFA